MFRFSILFVNYYFWNYLFRNIKRMFEMNSFLELYNYYPILIHIVITAHTYTQIIALHF